MFTKHQTALPCPAEKGLIQILVCARTLKSRSLDETNTTPHTKSYFKTT